jgi:arginyl-tRNA synthetase
MNLYQLQGAIREKVRKAAGELFNVELDQVALEFPPKTEMGDFAFPIAFELAKRIKAATGEKQNPRQIAESLRTVIESDENVARVEVAGAGYLNVFLKRAKFLAESLTPSPDTDAAPIVKVCVEHTSVNPNKAAHIGHVRNSVLGDTFVRILRSTGKQVEVQNYIDNTGVQVADVVVGFIYLKQMDLPAIKALDSEITAKGSSFDYYCWDLYTEVGQAYQADESLKEKRAEVLHLIEGGNNETATLADYVASRNVECILKTMDRFSIRYDLLPRESEILHLHFWQKAFETMKQLGAIHFETEGKNAGCWVMPFESHSGTEEHEADKILVRSNGTVTYTGKDIAYQMWKLGILGMDFYYRPFYTYDNGSIVWTTADHDVNATKVPSFGHGSTVYNVIDSRQSYPQEIVKQGVAALAPEKGETASIHLSYEMVALSPTAAEELGFSISEEDRKRPFIEMSGRKGLGVKADDLLNRLEANALLEVESRHPDMEHDEKASIAHQLAVGALRYFLLKFTRNTVIVFDFKEALSFEGETGCFCQYSAVRANSIFRKLDERDEQLSSFLQIVTDPKNIDGVLDSSDNDDIWSLIVLASRLEDVIHQSADSNEPAILARYTFNLAKAFNLFYHNHKIISEENREKRAVLVLVADMVRNSVTTALATMGITVPERM